MTSQERYAPAQQESDAVFQAQQRSKENRQADFPRRAEGGALDALARSAGNAAMSEVLDKREQGAPLDPAFRLQMERSLGANFSGVRVHDDASAKASAAEIDAEAFTHGEEITLGANAPSPADRDGKELLAHELVHVAQQQRATTLSNEISSPGDESEREASYSSQQAMRGEAATVSAVASAPGVQRQVDVVKKQVQANTASRKEVEQAVLEFLQRAQAAQGGAGLQLTSPVKAGLQMLAQADDPSHQGGADRGKAGRAIAIDAVVSSHTGDVALANVARRVAQVLPDPFDQAALEKLKTWSVTESGGSAVERLAERAKRSFAKPEPSPRDPQQVPPEKRLEDEMDKARAVRGAPKPKEYGVSVDVLGIIRFAQGDKKPKTGKPQPEAKSYPAVEQAISKIAPDVLIPAEAKGTEQADNFADAREVAADLAGKLDIAQQRGDNQIELRLPATYSQAKDEEAIIAALVAITRAIRDALPHHAAAVKYVDIYFGPRLVMRNVATSSQ
jgi:hypothetical protein